MSPCLDNIVLRPSYKVEYTWWRVTYCLEDRIVVAVNIEECHINDSQIHKGYRVITAKITANSHILFLLLHLKWILKITTVSVHTSAGTSVHRACSSRRFVWIVLYMGCGVENAKQRCVLCSHFFAGTPQIRCLRDWGLVIWVANLIFTFCVLYRSVVSPVARSCGAHIVWLCIVL